LDQYIAQSEKLYKEHGDKLSDSDKQNIDTALQDAKDALQNDDYDKIIACRETLQSVMYKVSESLYQSVNDSTGDPSGEDDSDEEIIDAEVV
jgi:molecular chaperone DnaK